MTEPKAVKVVLLGESGVGKTSIIQRFINNTFNPRPETSVSAQFVSKTMQFPEYNKTVKFDIWDTVGQEKYRSLAKIFYKDAKIIIFVYDITSEYSFKSLKNFWYKETKDNADEEPIFALVANKDDLYSEEQVDNVEGKKFAEEIKAIFQTTSCYSAFGVDNLFENLGKKILNPKFDYKEKERKIKENLAKSKEEEKNNDDKGKNKDDKNDNKNKDKIKLDNTNKNTKGKKCC